MSKSTSNRFSTCSKKEKISFRKSFNKLAINMLHVLEKDLQTNISIDWYKNISAKILCPTSRLKNGLNKSWSF